MKRSPSRAAEIKKICSEDILFWINTFCYGYDPRNVGRVIMPFITYPYQDEGILWLMKQIEKGEDGLWKKSRDMGITFNTLQAIAYRCQFRENESYVVMSGKEAMVEKSDSPNTLFWKLDFILEKQPVWLRGRWKRVKLHYSFPETGSTIDGESTTEDVGRSGRPTMIFFDEFAMIQNSQSVFAATTSATYCRIFVSTPRGTATGFYAAEHVKGINKRYSGWWLHPEKKKGLYKSENGQLVIEDKAHKFPDDYPFILDGKLRSPAYDKAEARSLSKAEMAQEWDMNDGGAGYQFFDTAVLENQKTQFGLPPITVGELTKDKDFRPDEFKHNERGLLKLWCNLIEGKRPPKSEYVIGVDVAAGTGASNSCISIANTLTAEKIGEYVNSRITATELAELAFALGLWFSNEHNQEAHIIWESNGHGRTFGSRLLDLNYGNIYYRKYDDSETIDARMSKYPGWHSTKDSKNILLGEYNRALKMEEYVNRSIPAIEECGEYIAQADGSIVHTGSVNSIDPTGAKDAHGDRVIADALTWWIMREQRTFATKREREENKIPASCFYNRRKEYEEAENEEKAWVRSGI